MIDLDPPITEIDYTPRGGAKELFECRAMRVLMDGPAGTGKTRAILEKVHALCEKYPGSRHWIGRETRESMTESVLVTLETKVMWPSHPALQTGGQRSQRQAYKFPNGSTIVVGGLDKPEKTFSAEYDTCSVFESVECSANDLELLLRTLRNGVLPYQQQILDTNPGAFTHHLNQACSAGSIRRILSRHEDNPLLWQDGDWTDEGRKYIAILDALTGARRERLRFGRWVNAEGVVYDGFDAAVHVIDAMPPGWESWDKYRSIDFGFTNPFVCQWWAKDPDGRLYLYREIYRTQRTVRDHAQQIKGFSESTRETVTDHDAEDRATLGQEGIESVAAKKDVRPGLDAVAMRLRVQGDGRPRLFFVRGSHVESDPHLAERKAPLCTIDEFDCYMWRKSKDGSAVKEEPDKVNDHGMDAMRYMVMRLDGDAPSSVAFVGQPSVQTVRWDAPPTVVDFAAEEQRRLAAWGVR